MAWGRGGWGHCLHRESKTTILPTEMIKDCWGARGMGALPPFLQICQGSYGMRGGLRHESGAENMQEGLSMWLQYSQHKPKSLVNVSRILSGQCHEVFRMSWRQIGMVTDTFAPHEVATEHISFDPDHHKKTWSLILSLPHSLSPPRSLSRSLSHTHLRIALYKQCYNIVKGNQCM